MKNRIAKLVDISKIDIFEEDLPSLNDGEILVQIKSCGICGSDLHFFRHGGLGSFKEKLPMYMGHEPSGIIVDSNKSKVLSDHDRVAIEPGCSCVECYWCKKDKENLCSNGTFMGAGHQGAFADYVVVREDQLIKIPDTMSYETAALMEPLGVALHSTNLLAAKRTDTACIFGAGCIGISLIYVLQRLGVTDILAHDPLEYRSNNVKKYGVVSEFDESVFLQTVKEKTNGFGGTLVFDAAGTDKSLNGCIVSGSVTSKLAMIGIPEQDYISLNPHKMRTKEMTLQNVRRSNRTLDDCIELFKDHSVDEMVSHRYDLDNIQEAFEVSSQYNDNVIKCMINS